MKKIVEYEVIISGTSFISCALAPYTEMDVRRTINNHYKHELAIITPYKEARGR